MERFDGSCLQNCLNRFKVDLLHRLHIITDIATALEFCHSHNIVHFDLKPQNVFVALMSNGQRRYTCKLFDFGCSFEVADEIDSHMTNSYENVGVRNFFDSQFNSLMILIDRT